MANITLSLPDEIYQKLKLHPEIRWSEIARRAIIQYLEDLELMEKLTSESRLSEADVQELSEMIDSDVLKRIMKQQSN